MSQWLERETSVERKDESAELLDKLRVGAEQTELAAKKAFVEKEEKREALAKAALDDEQKETNAEETQLKLEKERTKMRSAKVEKGKRELVRVGSKTSRGGGRSQKEEVSH